MKREALVPVSVGSVVVAAICLCLVAGCSQKVENIDPTQEVYISGRWNDADARAVADQVVLDCLERSWLPEFRGEYDRGTPRVLVGDIENNTNEHIDTNVFMNEIERVLINSGVVDLVADENVRDHLMREVKWQKSMAREEGVAPDVEEGVSGADFIMMGAISSVVDQVDKDAVVYYKVDLWLIDLREWEKVWIGSAERKHLVEGTKIRF